ncbi:MAG: nickel-dependent hydrogenase large subunit [Rhodomicrobium sp.]
MTAPAEGIICIELTACGGKGAVRIENTRPLAIANRFSGRRPAEVAGLVPLVFSICRAAQSAACAQAIENALGEPAGARQKSIRDLLVLAETAREHALQVLHSWPRCLHAPEPALASAFMKRLLRLDRELSLCLHDGSDLARLRHGIAELTALLGEAIFGEVPAEWLSRRDMDSLGLWAQRNETLAQTLVEYLVQTGTADAGASDIAPLPQLTQEDLQNKLFGENADSFIARPQWGDLPRETTPLSRLMNHRLIESVRDRYGYGLLARLAACLVELAEIPERMLSLAGSLAKEDGKVEASAGQRDHGTGLGFAEAARGRLIHAAEIEGGLVRRYRILAPTEWNFHPEGAAARGLASIAAGAPARREALARLFITAVDPCVGYELRLS